MALKENLFLSNKSFTTLDLVLLTIFMIFLFTYDIRLPSTISNTIDSVYGNIVVLVVFIIIFMNTNNVVGIVGFLVAYELIRRSTSESKIPLNLPELPSEEEKILKLEKYNSDQQTKKPDTLEEEAVDGVVEYAIGEKIESDVKPILHKLHNATDIIELE